MQIVALVVGATGIAGRGVSQELLDRGAEVYGLSRKPEGLAPGVTHVAADLTNPQSVKKAVAGLKPTHVYLDDMVAAGDRRREHQRSTPAPSARSSPRVAPARSVVHVALVTGLKHYLGPFDAYVRAGTMPLMPVREEQPRLDIPNFYYAQEDEVYAAAARDGFTWSVHRPHTIIGKAIGNAMNMGSTLAAYASICKETGRKFKFPGSAAQWNGLSDMTDSRILGKQLVWASTNDLRQEQGLQHRQRRHIPLELDVAAHRQMVRRGMGGLHRRGDAARNADGRGRRASGSASRRSMVWSNPISPASPRPGTPTSISAGRSR